MKRTIAAVSRVFLALQRKICLFFKTQKRFSLLSVIRHRSAFFVVTLSISLVFVSNFTNGHESRVFLLGYFFEKDEEYVKTKSAFIKDTNDYDSFSLITVAKADTRINTDLPDEKITPTRDGELIASADTGVLKDPEEDGGVRIYTVKSGDTLSEIAKAHKITANTILWANDIEDINDIMPGDTLFILPVSGLSYKIEKDESLDDIAKKYESSKDAIIAFNNLPANGLVEEGTEIIIPGGRKEVPLPLPSTNIAVNTAPDVLNALKNENLATSGWKTVDTRKKGNNFPYGYCTYYVAQHRNVTWRGNAGAWLYNAKVQGYKTGKTPKKGSIVVTTDSAYYGHVALVEKVTDTTITVSEMNYKAWGKVNTRVVSLKDRKIKGYIY